MRGLPHRYRYVLLAAAASVAVLAGGLLLPAAASAQPASTPATPKITLGLSPATVDYGHQNVTASGTVTTTAGPVASAAVTVSYVDIDGQPAQVTLTTGTDGSYSGTIPDPETAAQTVTAAVAATASTTTASVSQQLGFTTDAVTITASFAEPDVNAGTADVLSGVASYVSEGTTHPLANSTLTITAPGDYPPISPVNTTVTTGADGSFSYTLTPVPDGAGMDFTVSSAATSYLQAGQVTVPLLINMAAGVDLFTGSLTPYHQLRFDACAGIGAPLANDPLLGPLDYQYSKEPGGPWETLGAATQAPYNQAECAGSYDYSGDGQYPGDFTAPLASGYYRAYAPAVPGQMSAVSQVIHLQRDSTKITGFAITPRRVRHGGKVTVSGRLWHLKSTWLPDARGQIVIEFRYKGKTYTLKHRLTTNSAGRFHGIFAVSHTAAWLALYKGGENDFAVTSQAITVEVR